MTGADFDSLCGFKHDYQEGLIAFHNSRVVCFDTNALGMLRQKLIDDFGLDKAREFFLKFGFEQGYSDFIQIKSACSDKFVSETELLTSVIAIQTCEGFAHATTTEVHCDRKKDEFYFSGTWSNSFEAEQHLSYNEAGNAPVCWSLMGYMSGWCTAFFGKPLVAIESSCEGNGDARCEWEVKPPSIWGEKATVYTQALQTYFDKIRTS
jgi:hypothetical protein